MNEYQYMEKLNQAGTYKNHTDSIEKVGQESMYRDIPMAQNMEASISADTPLPYLEMGSGFIIGLAVGFFIKKSFKIVLFILGFALISTFYMESQGIFTINNEVLEQSIASGAKYFDFLVASVKERITSFQSGAGSLAGFIVGLKIG